MPSAQQIATNRLKRYVDPQRMQQDVQGKLDALRNHELMDVLGNNINTEEAEKQAEAQLKQAKRIKAGMINAFALNDQRFKKQAEEDVEQSWDRDDDSDEEMNAFLEGSEAIGRIMSSKNRRFSAIKEGMSLAYKLRKQEKDGRISMQSFMFVLLVCLFKDFYDPLGTVADVASLGATWATVGPVLNFAAWMFLFVFFLGRKSYLKRWLIKKFLGKFIMIAIAEFIPGVNIFPGYTLGIILLKRKTDKNANEKKEKRKKIERYVRELQGKRGKK